ncbi:histone-fold-containing protein [Dissophora ornata]|nr:histone-fold-containing protein [Dissophora ornata]
MHLLQTFWMRQMHEVQNVPQDFKVHHLPLARIKKVMKTDDDAKMISADAPMIFDKGCEIFITELTLRAWIHAEENKRRTLQRSDIAAAIAKTDMFDFLIDIVPREEYKISLPKEHKTQHGIAAPDRRRSQEMFQPMPGPGSATGPKGPSGVAGVGGTVDPSIGLEGYYPYGVLDNNTFASLVSDLNLQLQVGLCFFAFFAVPHRTQL